MLVAPESFRTGTFQFLLSSSFPYQLLASVGRAIEATGESPLLTPFLSFSLCLFSPLVLSGHSPSGDRRHGISRTLCFY